MENNTQSYDEPKVVFSSDKAREIIDKQEPIDRGTVKRVKDALAEKGWVLEQSEDGDRLLENSGKEGMTFSEGTIVMHTKVSASGFYEELIHYGQIRAGRGTYDPIENVMLEIEAKERLLAHQEAYRITPYEKELLTEGLGNYKIHLEALTRGGI